jgi:hypothetical protein
LFTGRFSGSAESLAVRRTSIAFSGRPVAQTEGCGRLPACSASAALRDLIADVDEVERFGGAGVDLVAAPAD